MFFVGDAGKELASYEPASRPEVCRNGLEPTKPGVSVSVSAIDQDEVVVLVDVSHRCATGDQAESAGESFGLFRFDSRTGSSSVTRLQHFAPGLAVPSFQHSRRGDYVLAVISGELHRIDTRTGLDETSVSCPLTFLDWPIHDPF